MQLIMYKYCIKNKKIYSSTFHLYKTLRFLSTRNPNPIITCCSSRSHPRFPKKFHSIPQRRSSTAANESTAASWSAFPKSTPPSPPIDSAPRKTPVVQTVYDPTTGRVVTKREYNGSKELNSDVKNAENPSGMEVGSKVYGDVIGSSSVRSSIKKGKSRSVHICSNCGYSDGQWWGTCKQCGEVGTMKRFATESTGQKTRGMQVSENAVRSWLPKESIPIKLTDVYSRIDDTNWRIPLPGEFGSGEGAWWRFSPRFCPSCIIVSTAQFEQLDNIFQCEDCDENI